METTRPFGDASGNVGESLLSGHGQAPSAAALQPIFLVQGGTEYKHPFKIEKQDDKVIVYPGWVYGLKDGRVYNRVQVQLNATDLGDPFLGETMPTLAIADGLLWLKVELSGGEIDTVSIVYETDVNAQDDAATHWIEIGETATTGAIKQRLKSDAFVTLAGSFPFRVTPDVAGSGQVLVESGWVYYGETPTYPTAEVIRYYEMTGATVSGVVDGDWIYVHTSYAASGGYGGVFNGNVNVPPVTPIIDQDMPVIVQGPDTGGIEFIADVANLASTNTDGYLPIAQVTIDGGTGKISVQQIFTGGLLHLPFFTYPTPV